MVCNPSDNSINPPTPPPPPFIPGFGIAFAPPNIPFPDLEIGDAPEDLLELVNAIIARLPGNIKIVPNLDEFTKSVLQAVNDLLSKITPFLALYSFFQSLLNMILCIIDIICALLNPFKLFAAIKRLFKRCLPDFLALFPWIALFVMVVTLLLLLLALIEYIINLILAFINDILANINQLTEAFRYNDDAGALAIITKISQLLCLIQDIVAILVALQAIFVIIESLLGINGRFTCVKGQSDCCTDEVCPPFLTNNQEGISGTTGTLRYYNQGNQPVVGLPSGIVLPVLREESWQFYDNNDFATYKVSDIITPISGFTYWPGNQTFADSGVPQVQEQVLNLSENLSVTIPGISPVSSPGYNNFFLYSAIQGTNSLLDGYQLIDGANVTFSENSGAVPGPVTIRYIENLNSRKVPYFVDMEVNLDPASFGHTTANIVYNAAIINNEGVISAAVPTNIGSLISVGGFDLALLSFNENVISFPNDTTATNVTVTYAPADFIGTRKFIIKDCIPKVSLYIGVKNWDNGVTGPNNGTFSLTGGRVFEADGVTPFVINNNQATITNFIHKDARIGVDSSDGYFFDASFTWRGNFEALFSYQLISSGCLPEIQTESIIANFENPIVPAIQQIGPLPNVSAAITCLSDALNELRKNVSIETTQEFQSKAVLCLETLRSQTKSTLTTAVTAGISPYKTEVSLDPDVQFVELPITVTVTPRDQSSTDIASNLPLDVASDIAKQIVGQATFGNITEFRYDGYGAFIAEINSDIAGSGELKVLVNNEVVSRIVGRDDDNVSTRVEPLILGYEFIGLSKNIAVEPAIRRDETDVSRS